MLERKRFLSRVVTLAIAFIVGVTMVFGTGIGVDEVSAASKKPSKVTISKIESYDYNAVKITWKKAKNAKKYQVYRSTKHKSGYKLIKTTTSTSYVNKGLTTGKKYYYKVRAVNGSKKGKFSYRKLVIPKLKTPSIKSVTSGKNYTITGYSKVNGASAYQLYRSTSKSGGFARVGSYKELKVTNKGLKENTTYYYKVRAYRKVNGSYKYSNFSKVVAVKTKHTCNWKYGASIGRDYCTICKTTKAHLCIKSKDDLRPMYGAGYDYTKGKYVAPTCTEKGYQEYVCVCGEKTYTYVNATGHKFDKIIGIVKEPTCSEDGISKGVCTVCGETSTFTVPKIGCTWEPIVETKYDGYYLYKPVLVAKECNICYERVALDGVEEHKTLHQGENTTFFPIIEDQKSDEYVVTSEDVVVGWKCSTCGKVNDCDHSWYATKDTYHGVTCKLCGEDVTTKEGLSSHISYHAEEGMSISTITYIKKYLKCRLCGVDSVWSTNNIVCGEDHFVLE